MKFYIISAMGSILMWLASVQVIRKSRFDAIAKVFANLIGALAASGVFVCLLMIAEAMGE